MSKNKSLKIRDDEQKQAMKNRLICKKCGKDVEYTNTIEIHTNCPRCRAPLGRDLGKEHKQAKRVYMYDFLRRNKKYFLYISIFLTIFAIGYNVVGFFAQLFSKHGWYFALLSIPFVVFSSLATSALFLKTSSRKIRILSLIAIILNLIAIAAIVVTSVPELNEKLMELYEV